jgi:hypothetical protein
MTERKLSIDANRQGAKKKKGVKQGAGYNMLNEGDFMIYLFVFP